MKLRQATMFFAAAAAALTAGAAHGQANTDWAYHGGNAVDRYSPLTQITPANVTTLREAWRFTMPTGSLQAQATKVGRTVYAVTTDRKVVALDAVTGQPRWTFDAAQTFGAEPLPGGVGPQPIRGLATWTDGGKLRLLMGRDSYVYMIDAETGTLVTSFGRGGRIDARENLRGPADQNGIYVTSPVVVYQDLIIVNGREAENTPASPGDVRAFDARTGKLVWTFRTIPAPGDEGAETWPADARQTQGGANAWSGASVDTERGIVFVNTGSPADDFVGIHRPGDNRFANSTIALDAKTGKRLWDFQQVHHDLWDSDSTSPPLLTTISQNGRRIPVAVAWNKAAYVYVFDRYTGKPIFPIVETPVPPSNVPGEIAAKTQPIPTLPKPISRKTITVDDLTKVSPEKNAEARALLAGMYGASATQPFVPLGLNQNTLVLPGFAGAWGGMGADRDGVIYLTALNTAGMSRIVDNRQRRAELTAPGARPAGQNGIAMLDWNFTGYGSFVLSDGTTALDAEKAGPVMHAIDLNTGQYRWTVPLPGRNQGSGPLITASGLLFISAGNRIQAHSTRDGSKLWETQLPGVTGNGAGTYMQDGKQYVVIATGGGGGRAAAAAAAGPPAANGPTPAYVAYALP